MILDYFPKVLFEKSIIPVMELMTPAPHRSQAKPAIPFRVQQNYNQSFLFFASFHWDSFSAGFSRSFIGF